MLTRPVVVPFRWQNFGLDLRAIVQDNGTMLFLCKDVCEALNLAIQTESDHAWPLEHTIYSYPGFTRTVETAGGHADQDIDQAYEAAEVRRLALDNPDWFTEQFLDWLYELQHPGGGDVNVALFRDPEPAIPEIAAGRTYSVARAARILSGDPVLNLGMHALFAAMQEHGWISRDREIWVPHEDQLRSGHLVRQRQRVRGRKELYPQIRITREGLTALHAVLGGIATLSLDDGPDLTLLELT